MTAKTASWWTDRRNVMYGPEKIESWAQPMTWKERGPPALAERRQRGRNATRKHHAKEPFRYGRAAEIEVGKVQIGAAYCRTLVEGVRRFIARLDSTWCKELRHVVPGRFDSP